MSGSTDSLKKKVCVTVFLDELFEEVLEEDRQELKQVSELTGSRLKLSESTYKESPPAPLDNDEKVDVCPNADVSRSQLLLRPRKHRRESKFSKSRDDSVKKELTKYGYGSCVAPRNECCEGESAGSDSDMNLDEFPQIIKGSAESSKSSTSGLSEIEATEESFLSVTPNQSSVWNLNKDDETLGEGGLPHVGSTTLACDGSTRFDEVESEKEETRDDDIPDEEAEREAADNIPAWKATQRKIQFALAEAGSGNPEEEGDHVRPYDLKTILEECVRAESAVSPKDSAIQSTDSYTCIFPHDGRRNKTNNPEVERVWSGTRRKAWNDGFESDLSEADCPPFTKTPVLDDSLLCYILRLKCGEDVYRESGKDENPSKGTLKYAIDSESIGKEPSFGSVKSKSAKSQDAELFRTLAQLANKVVLEAILKSEMEEHETRNGTEGDIPVEACRKLPAVEGWNKNFAEGDTIRQSLSKDLVLDFEAKSKLLLCNDVFQKNVEEAEGIHHNIIVNRAEVKLGAQDGAKEKAGRLEDVMPAASSVLVGPTQILFRQTSDEFGGKTTTDAESELVFAESENSCRNEVLSDERDYEGSRLPDEKEICVLEFEDKLSRSNILRRMKTVEILSDASLKDMRNISTEVILICENMSDNEVSLEAWHSNSSTQRSVTEMGQCYLKDSKDSAMYLIEIPLQFTKVNAGKPAGSEHLLKARGSD